jgi:hypothetical protein
LKTIGFLIFALTILLLTYSNAVGGNSLDRESLLANMYIAKDYEFDRVASLNPAGPDGSDVMKPGEVREIADIKGPAIISHIWFTLSRKADYVLKDCVLRIYWDDEKEPSVEVPIGEFFGLGHGRYYSFHSIPFEVGNGRGYNCFLPMPFAKRCRITFENSPDHGLRRLFYHINYKRVKQLPPDSLYFHAQYRQAKPTNFEDSYTILEAEGRGHFVGLFYYNRPRSGWWGDGGERIEVDGRVIPATGQEDYFCQGWSFGKGEQGLRFGSPLYESADKQDLAENAFYRFHIEDPIPFNKSFRMTMRHGIKNERREDDYSTVAFWYQTEPHKPFPKLPPARERYHSVKEKSSEADGGIPTEQIEY